MPRMAVAVAAASSALSALRMPPALPRLPVGTWAFTTHGPISAKAAAASCGERQSLARGMGTPAGASTMAFAACSSKFIAGPARSAPVFRPMGPEQRLLARLVLGNRRHQVSDVEEVLVAEILRDAVLLPRAAAHAEGEAEPAVEAAAIPEGVGEVDEHARHLELLRELARMSEVLGMDAAGMALALIGEDRAHGLLGRGEILGAIDGEHKRELLAGKGVATPDPRLLDHEEIGVLGRLRQAKGAHQHLCVAGDELAVELPVLP